MANIELDFRGLMNLRNMIQDFDNKYDAFLDRFVSQTGLKCERMVKQLTPVGEHPNDVAFYARKGRDSSELNLVELHGAGEGMTGGTLRRSWKVTPVRRNGGRRQVTFYADSTIAPYAVYVEHGHRTVAFNSKPPRTVGWWEGHHMAKDTLEIVDIQIPEAFNRSFMNFVRGIGM